MKPEIRLKIISSKNEHIFASAVEEFINDKAHIIARPPEYAYDNGLYVAFVEYQNKKEQDDE